MAKKNSNKSKRYTPGQKAVVLGYAAQNGVAAAIKKFGVSGYSINLWRKRSEARSEGEEKKPQGKLKRGTPIHDAIIYLRHARDEFQKQAAAGRRLERGQLLALMALDALEGGG